MSKKSIVVLSLAAAGLIGAAVWYLRDPGFAYKPTDCAGAFDRVEYRAVVMHDDAQDAKSEEVTFVFFANGEFCMAPGHLRADFAPGTFIRVEGSTWSKRFRLHPQPARAPAPIIPPADPAK